MVVTLRTSSTPGKTRLVNWFRIVREHDELWLVDLPGYGYAKVSKAERRSWQKLVESYLEARPTLRVAVLLQESARTNRWRKLRPRDRSPRHHDTADIARIDPFCAGG